VAAEYRIDPETGDWRIVAPDRAGRPTDIAGGHDAPCPFDPGHEDMTMPEVLRVPAGKEAGTETGKEEPWRVRIVPNRYPVLDDRGAWPEATGLHEVVIESPRHDADLKDATTEAVLEVLKAMRERCRVIVRERRPAAIVVFRNHGAAAGTSLRHPHSQIVALDQAPPGLLDRWQRARRFLEETGRRLHDEEAARERAEQTRIVHDADGLLVYQPRAAAVSHETVLLPDDESAGLAGASDDALKAMARMLPAVASALASVRDDPAYNLVVHAGPATEAEASRWYRWHIGLYPRVNRRAGLEIATGLGVNPTVPEKTAPVLKAALKLAERAPSSSAPPAPR
jgi:UDPglucose--hexose-1-phosphate uridylyltransferase